MATKKIDSPTPYFFVVVGVHMMIVVEGPNRKFSSTHNSKICTSKREDFKINCSDLRPTIAELEICFWYLPKINYLSFVYISFFNYYHTFGGGAVVIRDNTQFNNNPIFDECYHGEKKKKKVK